MGLLQRVVGVLLGLLFLVSVLVFASLALGVLLAAGLVLWGWLWWRSRKLGMHRGARRPGSHIVVEGEFDDLTPSQRVEDRERR